MSASAAAEVDGGYHLGRSRVGSAMAPDTRQPHLVVFIDLVGDTGGAEALAAELLARVDPARFRRTLVVYGHFPADSAIGRSQARAFEQLRSAGVEILELHRTGRLHLRAWAPFLRLLRRDTDILHSHKFGPNLWAALFSRLRRAPVFIAHEHGWSFEGGPLRRLLDRWVIGATCDVFLAVSEANRRRMVELERVPDERVRLLPNGIPTPATSDGRDVRSELGLPSSARIVGAVGIFRTEKDFPLLVRAHELVRRRVGDCHLVLIGDGPTRPDVEAVIAELQVGDHVHLLGLRTDVTRLVSGFDVAVNASHFEGSSLAVLEYMALARPIVATAVGGTPDLLGHGEAGVLVPPREPEALADAIAELLLDGDRARSLGRRAQERQRREYDIAVQVQRLEDLYAGLLSGSRRLRAVAA